MAPFKKILCPTDLSEPSYKAIEKANALAALCSADLFILQVIPSVTILPGATVDPAAKGSAPQDRSFALLERSLGALIEERISKGLRVHPMVLTGSDAAERIIRFADEEGIDLIVIASHGQSGWKRLLFGSVTEKVLKHASCSVLLIQAPH
ncbi:MAG: universal stress protein [Deltaproteobacteria bacterium]|nr:universal stress protein [Deltaproteobacteria bacterium]